MRSARLALLLPDMGGGGAERVALTLIRSFVARGHSVDLLLKNAHGDLLRFLPEGVRVLDLEASRVRNVVRPLARYLRQERPDAIQVSMWPLTVAAIIARKLSGTRTRLIVSDHAALSRQYAGRGLVHRQLLKWTIRLFYPWADARVVVAADAGRDLALLSGLPLGAFEVIYNPVDPVRRQAPDPEVERLWGGPGSRILNVGRLAAQKNQRLLLDAFARLAAGREARLLILGEGQLRGQLERRAAELGIADRVAMPGFRIDPQPFYESADLFVLSSDFEGYPLVLIEALQCGLPIVSTDCPTGPSEILAGGEAGRLVPCGDAAGLAEAMAAELQSTREPEVLKARAAELSRDAAERYLELMTPQDLTSTIAR